MFKSLLKSLAISLSVLIVICLIVLIPRQPAGVVPGSGLIPAGWFDWPAYRAGVSAFAHSLLGDGPPFRTRYDEPLLPVIWAALRKSLLVLFAALLAGFLLGTLKGIFDYKMSRGRLNFLGGGSTWLIQSAPDFLVLLLAQWFIIHHANHIRFYAHEGIYAFIVPFILASIYPVFYVARITAASIATEDGRMYIRTAQAKGMPNRIVFYRHILSNSMPRVLTHFAPLGVYILSSLLLIEYLRNFVGAPLRMFQAFDYQKMMGTGDNYEPALIIGLAVCFMVLVHIFELIGYLAKKRYASR
ncbi:ABC transporter permease subunit [Saccharibacillus sp. CPCC 101409]|uniref:ABC transporter permease subunit n=1 Tax=Saccharibacillus sp. CPCC 101409 TaxID=3058041 RepID=UPI002673314C|nr:ABC transporter permease subunit [Saccharibacillus sp. CPCC 101409]MDO3408720.1 ABC transporter permease subunit [Saccharibacillus sp. CPCC 101409]